MSLSTFHDHCPYDIPYYCVYSAMDTAYHIHEDFYEFIFVTSGSFRNIMKDKTAICETDLLLFFHPGESHEFVINEATASHYAFIVKKEYFEDYLKKYCALHSGTHAPSDIPSFVAKKLSGFQMTYLSQLASTIAYITSPGSVSTATHLLDILLFILLNDVPASEFLNTKSYAVDLRSRLDNYHSLEQSLAELYSNYPISSYTVSSHFKQLTGYTVVEYRNVKRMEYAAHLLVNEKLSVTSIANLMNISNLSYFAKQFKKQFGLTPKQYQLRHKK